MSGWEIKHIRSAPELREYEYSDSSVGFAFDVAMQPEISLVDGKKVERYNVWRVGPKVARHQVVLGAIFEYMDNIREYFSTTERLKVTKDGKVVLSFRFSSDRLLPKWRQRTDVIKVMELGPMWAIDCEIYP